MRAAHTLSKTVAMLGVLAVLMVSGCAGRPKPATSSAASADSAAVQGARRESRPQVPPTGNPAPAPATAADGTSAARDGAPAWPQPRQPTISSGQYLLLGAVVAEANGQPIYAEKVLARLDPLLSARAKELSAEEFRKIAAREIAQQVRLEIFSELEFAAAQRHTSPEDVRLARTLTALWRDMEIRKAGGSEAVARRRSLDETRIDFDERVEDKYREYLIRIYIERQIQPRVQISADDMRRYYEQNAASEFTRRDSALFRVIQVNYSGSDGLERAQARIASIIERVGRGEDFAELAASAFNDNRTWRANRGYVLMQPVTDAEGNRLEDERGQPLSEPAWVEKGTLNEVELERAVFETEKGQLTRVVQTPGRLFIARVEDRQIGAVRPFEDLAVQRFIYQKLRAEQFQNLRNRRVERLLASAVVRQSDRMLEPAIQMAMQRYALWNEAR